MESVQGKGEVLAETQGQGGIFEMQGDKDIPQEQMESVQGKGKVLAETQGQGGIFEMQEDKDIPQEQMECSGEGGSFG